MTFKDELMMKVIFVRKTIKSDAINAFIELLKSAMENAAEQGETNGVISIGYELDEEKVYVKLKDLLLLTKEINNDDEICRWLLKEIGKTDIFKDIYINRDDDVNYLNFYWFD